MGVTTFALAPKDVEARYGRITPALAEWIAAHGELLTSVQGDSYGVISLYHVGADVPAPGAPPTPQDLEEARPRQRRFGPATGGLVSGMLLILGVWVVMLGALAGGLVAWQRRLPVPAGDPVPDLASDAAPEGDGGGG